MYQLEVLYKLSYILYLFVRNIECYLSPANFTSPQLSSSLSSIPVLASLNCQLPPLTACALLEILCMFRMRAPQKRDAAVYARVQCYARKLLQSSPAFL